MEAAPAGPTTVPPGRWTRARWAYLSWRRRFERALGNLLFERALGVETKERVGLESLGLKSEGRVDYVPSDWLLVRRALRAVPAGPDDVFIDFGAGKGRVVLMAARRPFKRVIGVELSEELKEIAEHNLEKNRHRLRCGSVEMVRTDAASYEVPDDVTVAYFYAPFSGQIFADVIANLIASIDRNPRRIWIIYNDPWDQNTLMFTGRVRQLRRWRLGPAALYALEPRRSA